MTAKPENLDLECATCAQRMASGTDVREATIGRALGVLQEDGVYACFLYLLSKKDKGARHVFNKGLEFLKEVGSVHVSNPEEVKADDLPKILDNVVGNLDRLFFAKELLERALIYARYHAKARESPSQGDRS